MGRCDWLLSKQYTTEHIVFKGFGQFLCLNFKLGHQSENSAETTVNVTLITTKMYLFFCKMSMNFLIFANTVDTFDVSVVLNNTRMMLYTIDLEY